jgi:hypothetical protein
MERDVLMTMSDSHRVVTVGRQKKVPWLAEHKEPGASGSVVSESASACGQKTDGDQ